jgi:serine protease Do
MLRRSLRAHDLGMIFTRLTPTASAAPCQFHRRSAPRALAVSSTLLALVLTACGGGSTSDSKVEKRSESSVDSVDTTEATPESTKAATTVPAAPEPTTTLAGGISSFQDVQPAVIQIIAEGSIRSVEDGQTYAAGGAGTGFIISPDGIAVTNNHVVTGAATLKVYIGGDLNKSYNATVLGVSECNDLAVIDINESEPLPTLEWSTNEIKAGVSVYAAGFPLGDPEFTLTSGIVGKVNSGGDMPWASIDGAIEHDAVIQPGNSGGPLVGEDGRVIAVNYAYKGGITAARYQSIKYDLATRVVEQLKKGDFESLGINGEAFVNEESGEAGVWVAGVAAGSPASKVGLLPGDIITAMNGLPVGQDGTMAAYCDVIRTSGERPIELEVLRYDTEEVLKGEIGNKDKPLVATFSFASTIDDAGVATDPSAVVVTGYETLSDDTGSLVVDVPTEWSDRLTSPEPLDDGSSLPTIQASPDLAAFLEGYSVPGLVFTRLPEAGVDEVLEAFAQPDCVDGGIDVYEDVAYTGKFQVWTGCGGTDTAIIVVAAISQDWSQTAILLLQATSDADFDVLDRAFASFVVTG